MPIHGKQGWQDPCPQLEREVNQQLLEDLRAWGIDPTGLHIDWSHGCGEGRDAHYLDGVVERDSEVYVVDESGNDVAGGWVDLEFCPDEGNPLIVFWESLCLCQEGKWHDLLEPEEGEPAIEFDGRLPRHIWQRMPDTMKENHMYANQKYYQQNSKPKGWEHYEWK